MENKIAKVSTSETKFRIGKYGKYKFNAFAYTNDNEIVLGKEIFTLESLVHELSEIDVTMIIERDFKEINRLVSFKIDSENNTAMNCLSHFMSPYGGFSAIYPSKEQFGKRAIHEEFLI